MKEASHSHYATIGPNITIKGDLYGEEDIVIQGSVEGTIELKNNNLRIGKSCSIKADVVANIIIVEGKVESNLYGKERIAIRKTSDIRGNITSARVTLEDGAKFHGSIDMDANSN